MKKYLADLLTLIRFILCVVLLIMAFLGGDLGAAFIIFILAELTDAFDGTCATKWPFPKNKTPKYRKYAAKYDMWTDAFLLFSMFLFFILRVNLVAGLILGSVILLAAVIVELIVYGKLFGHPDDATKNSLTHKNFKLAKKVILIRRNFYLIAIATVAAWTLYASNFPTTVKNIFTITALGVAIFLWFFLAQRRHNISRDAVDIEKKLSNSKQK
ncbi:MAG: CDP-alcohol phosphatidyltransferase family protein [Candidatus Saccharibacteria bacterium]|nr:CDP-alcohol phosphatidyltransferase family protein [Candidatus Saccharibacteria bacterium]